MCKHLPVCRCASPMRPDVQIQRAVGTWGGTPVTTGYVCISCGAERGRVRARAYAVPQPVIVAPSPAIAYTTETPGPQLAAVAIAYDALHEDFAVYVGGIFVAPAESYLEGTAVAADWRWHVGEAIRAARYDATPDELTPWTLGERQAYTVEVEHFVVDLDFDPAEVDHAARAAGQTAYDAALARGLDYATARRARGLAETEAKVGRALKERAA